MDKNRKSVIDALVKRRQSIAFDANVQRMFQVNTPHSIKCLEEYEQLTRRIQELEQPLQPSLFT